MHSFVFLFPLPHPSAFSDTSDQCEAYFLLKRAKADHRGAAEEQIFTFLPFNASYGGPAGLSRSPEAVPVTMATHSDRHKRDAKGPGALCRGQE